MHTTLDMTASEATASRDGPAVTGSGGVHGAGLQVLAEDSLFALQSLIELDGEVSSYPADASGYTVSNCYLLKEGNRALILDTGYAIHEKAIVAQIASVLVPGTPLSIYPLRLNELMSVSNVEALAEHFHLEQCYLGIPNASNWVDFGRRSDTAGHTAPPLKTTLVGRNQTLFVGLDQTRPVEAFQAPIRLIGTRWIYDGKTRTLFTSDSFSHEWCSGPEGPWVLGPGEQPADAAHVRSFLLNTRYWWLEGGSTSGLRSKLAAVFEKYDIENIAPGYGRITRGAAAVRRQYQVLDDVLRSLDKGVVAPRYVFRDDLR